MGFKEIQNIKLEYRTISDEVVENFYIPVLKKAKLYRRAVGFFSSSILIQISKGLCSMAERGAKIHLLISPELEPNDYEAIKRGYELKDYISDKFLKEIKGPTNDEETNRFSLLSHLISTRLLTVKIAILDQNTDKAMYHEKLGILQDDDQNMIAFTGSANETYNGYNLNYEAIDVYCSWKSYESEERCNIKELAFNRLWNGIEKGVTVLDFPEVIKNKILSFNKNNINIMKIDEFFLEKYRRTKTLPKCPSLENIKLHNYQNNAIDNWEKNNFRGIYDMATGTGKTYTGAGSICRLFEKTKRLITIVVCPFTHLVDQWIDELMTFNIEAIKCYGKINYEKNLIRAFNKFKFKRSNFVCLVITNSSFMKEDNQILFQQFYSDILLIVDEAHNFGAYKISQYLNENYKYRLALSATLERYGDDRGTKILYEFFGEKCITYSLSQAIIENKLTPYYYYPIIVNLENSELDEYIDLTKRIMKYFYIDKTNLPEGLKRLLIRRARLIAGANQKIHKLKEIIDPYKDDKNMLIYCGAVKYGDTDYDDQELVEKKQITRVINMLSQELGMYVSKFTSEEDSIERENLLKSFKEEEIQALVAIKCLDEGMNIPAIKTAFILASSTNPKEYIQRRGRVLRKYTGKKYAIIYDFITIPRPLDKVYYLSKDEKKIDLSLIKKEMIRLHDFANLSKNPAHSNEIFQNIKDAYEIDTINEGDVDYE